MQGYAQGSKALAEPLHFFAARPRELSPVDGRVRSIRRPVTAQRDYSSPREQRGVPTVAEMVVQGDPERMERLP